MDRATFNTNKPEICVFFMLSAITKQNKIHFYPWFSLPVLDVSATDIGLLVLSLLTSGIPILGKY
jgi:hypothetical protein